MDRISNMYDWAKQMRRKQRWGARGAVLQVKGAELVRQKPEDYRARREREAQPVKKESET